MDVNRILLDILVVLLAAKVAAEAADRLKIPAVVGEIVAGVLVGPSVLGWVHSSDALNTLAQLGVILLLLEVGLEMDIGELSSVGRAAVSVAFVGVLVPFVTGAGAGLLMGMQGKEAVFVGAALTATSVGITARVFGDLRALATVEARTVLGAAVADDILGLVILTVVVRVVTQGSVSALSVVWIVVVAIGFVVLTSLVGVRLVPPLFAFVRRYSRSAGTLVAIALAFTLAVAELAHAAKLAPIVGAFVAGIALARSPAAPRVRRELTPVAHLLVPVFFLQIGIDAQVDQFFRPAVFGTAAVLLVVAVLGKLVSVAGMVGAPGDRLLVGIGMIPRGEVGLIFATLGLSQHVFGQDVYAALLLVVLVSTVAPPPALRWRLLKLRAERGGGSETPATTGPALVHLDDNGYVVLDAEPGDAEALAVALRAARLCARRSPSTALLEWLDEFPPGPRRWDDAARSEMFALLREGEARSWRLLTQSGVLQRALPELDDALAHHRSDPLDVDPYATLTFERLARVNELIEREGQEPHGMRSILLAALVLDACGDDTDAGAGVARRTAQRLDLGIQVEESVTALVGDAMLLAAASRRIDALREEAVLQIAVHLGSIEQAHALYLLTRAAEYGANRELDALYQLVRQALDHSELEGRDVANEVELRRERAKRLVADAAVQSRILAAPRSYVITEDPVALARQAQMCEPPPAAGEVRVAVHATDGRARVEVVARDRVGLLARFTQVLAEAGYSVRHAVATTWGDGTALGCYELDPADLPSAEMVKAAFTAALDKPLEAQPVADVSLAFDDAGSPWQTRCTVTASDRPGLLHALAAAFAVAGVSVHAAQITTDGSKVVDQFDLTDRRGAKLDDRAKAAVVDAVTQGGRPRKRRLPRLRRAVML